MKEEKKMMSLQKICKNYQTKHEIRNASTILKKNAKCQLAKDKFVSKIKS